MPGNKVWFVWYVLIAVFVACAPARAATAHSESAHEHGTKATKKRLSTEQPFGREGDPRKVKRVIKVEMSDTMRFFPSEIRVKRGETVRFAISNAGQLPHEMIIGTMEELKKHAELMRKNGEMDHADSRGVHVAPGESGRMVWQFTKPGEFHYACLIAGHFEAGMIGTIVVR